MPEGHTIHRHAGEAAGRIVTVGPNDVGVRARKDIPPQERLYVYKRDGLPCCRCGDMVLRTRMANRLTWWCPTCQPSEGAGAAVD